MSTHKHFDKICCIVLAFTLLLTIFFINAERFGIRKSSSVPGYEERLFDTSLVHTIDIVMDDWDGFIEDCQNEEYYSCAVVIDGTEYRNVAIRAKGNTSLTQVEAYGNGRYSFKIEFDHYDSSKSYYGLDKLCLNNIIQDNTYMKDYLTYQMMAQMGVASPLCSYANITVNGEEWGLYLVVEGVEESFLSRNYGRDYGELYKPDSMSMGGGRGNGENFDMNGIFGSDEEQGADSLVNYPIDSPVSGGSVEDRPMLAWIFANEEYTQLYHQYFAQFLSKWFENGSFEEMADSVFFMIASYVEQDPTKFCTYEEFEAGVSTLKEFCLLRAESVDGQLNGTIGSTESGQDSEPLIVAGDLQISDMGTMNHAMDGGQGRPESRSEPNENTVAEGSTLEEGNIPAEGSTPAEGNMTTKESTPVEENMPTEGSTSAEGNPPQMPDGNGGSGAMGQRSLSVQTAVRAADPTEAKTWLAVSAGILILGIAFVFTARRRR